MVYDMWYMVHDMWYMVYEHLHSLQGLPFLAVLKGGAKSVQVLFTGIEAVLVLTLISLQ